MSKFEWEPEDIKIIKKPKTSKAEKAMQLVLTAEKAHTGAMLALYPDTPPTFTLQDPDLTPTAPDELHVTMAYLGNAADLDEEDRGFLRRLCAQIASEFSPISATLGGIGRFLNVEDDDTQAYYASVDSPDVEKLRARLVEVLGALGMIPENAHGFTPHMTLAYVPVGKPAAGAGLQEGPVEFGKLSLSLGGEREDFPFKASGEKQNFMLSYPDENKTQRFVFQIHARGKSAHGDFRVQSGDYLVGWTIPMQIPGAIKEPIETLAQANAAVANPDLWKMNLATGEIKPREIRSGVVRKGDLRALPKGVEIPCLVPGSLVWTDNGLKPIETIGLSDRVLSGDGEWTEVLGCEKTPIGGVEDCRLVRIKAGRSMSYIYTPDHPLLTDHGFVKASDIQRGDTLLMPKVKPTGKFSSFGFYQFDHSGVRQHWHEIKVDSKYGYFLGYLFGDGSVRGPSIYFSFGEKSLKNSEQLSEFIDSLDRTSKIFGPDAKNCYTLAFTDRGLADYLRSQHGFSSDPYQSCNRKLLNLEWLKDTSEDFLNGFVQGLLDSDGYESALHNTQLSITSAFVFASLLIGRPVGLSQHKPGKRNISPWWITGKLIRGITSNNKCFDLDTHWGFKVYEVFRQPRKDKKGTFCYRYVYNLKTASRTFCVANYATHNTDWLDEQGVTDKADPGEAIPTGATRNYPGVFKIVEKGTVEHGAKKPWLQELWIHGDKWGTQRWLFRLLERNKEVDHALQAEGWEEEAEEVKQDTLLPGVVEQQPRGETFWVFMQPDDQTPYVLGKEAIDKSWLPPKGVSALPKVIRDRVPKELRYWEVSGQEALDRRAKLAEMDVRELGGSSAKQLGPWQPYRLQYRYFRGPIQVRFGASTKFHDLWFADGTHYVIDGDPLTDDRLAAYQEHDKPTVSTADGKRVSVLRIGTDPVELAPGQPANPTKDTPAYVQTVDEGEVRVLDSQPEFTKLEFKGGKLKGAWYFRLEEAGSQIGEFGKSEGPVTSAKYSPGQARDEHGQWASGGGSSPSPISVKHSNLGKGVTRNTYSLDKVKGSELQVVKRPDGSRAVATFLVPESERGRGYGQQLLLRALKDGPIATESSGGVSDAYRRVQQALVRKGQVVVKPDEYDVSYMHLAKGGEKGVRPLFGSPGGKRLLAKTIVDLIPPHKVYVEPFAGGAAVLFAKPPEMSEKEVLADADPDIAFAYRTVKGLSDAEIERLNGMEWRIGKFDEVKDSRPDGKLGKLHRWWFLRRFSQGALGESQNQGQANVDRGEVARSGGNYTGSKAEHVPIVRDRLKSVQVRHNDYRDSLKEWDGKDTFFYLDPPYPATNRGSSREELRWEDEDCAAFADAVKKLKGKWLVSLQDNQTNRDLFKGYSIRTVTVPTVFNTGGGKGNDRRELLIANYSLPKRVRRKSMEDVEALQLVYTCMGCKGEFESEVVLGNPRCPGCADKALTWRPYLLQRHNDHHDLRIGDDFTLRLSGSLLDNEPDKAEVSTESPALQGADGQAVDALKVKPDDPVKLSDGEIQTLDKGQARYAKTQAGHQVEFKGGKLEGVYLFGPEGAHPVDLEHIDVEWEPGQPEPAEPDESNPDFPLIPIHPPQVNPDLIHPFNPNPPVIPGALPPPGMRYMGEGEVALGWKIAQSSTAEKDVVELEEKDKPSVDEGEKVGKRIKTEKLSKLQELRSSLESAVKWLGEVIGWASYEDKPEPSMLDFFKGSDYGFTVKTVQGEPWLFTWSANAFKDREGEIFSTKALETWADRASERDDKGTYNFWHIPGSDFAVKKWVGVPGRFLVEAGPFTHDAKGKAVQAFFAQYPDRHPTLAPEGWGCSVEYRYLPEERKKGVYQNVEITRTSVLPRFAAANTWTAVKEVTMALTDAQKKAAQELFGEDLAASILGEAEAKTKELEPNVAHKGEGEQTEPEAPVVQPEAEQVAPESEDDKAKKKPKEEYPIPEEEYPKPTKAEKKSLDQFVKAIRGIAESVTDDSAGRTALLEVADNLSEENLKDMAAKLKKAGKAVGRPDQKSRLAALVEALAGDGVYPAPAKKEFDPDSPEFITSVAAEISKQFKFDTQPIGEALTATAAALKGLEDRIAALETQSGRKAATDLPRFVFGLVEQASKADSTIVPEGDKLLDQKPKETQAAADGSIAAHFFTKPK